MVSWTDDERRIAGPDTRPERPGIRDALRFLRLPRRRPTPDDAPAPSTFPLTPAARAALQISRNQAKRKGKS